MILLGDMPLVTPEIIGRLIAAFNPGEGRAICVPVHEGRRGNPVLWGREFFAEIAKLDGDEGARRLLAAHADGLREVDAGSAAIHRDFDTPESLAELQAPVIAPAGRAPCLLAARRCQFTVASGWPIQGRAVSRGCSGLGSKKG